jgi:competence CoiA-like predicted nuclease
MEIRRTIEEVFDIQKGVEVYAKDFFRQPFDVLTQARHEQERANQEKRAKWLVCSTCGENIRILGGKSAAEILKPGKNFHFAHLHNSKDCPIKTTSKYSREDINRMRYRGIAEGEPHIELKAKLYQGLNLNVLHKGQVSELQLERVVRSLDENEWRKPDINLIFNNRRLAVELQLSTTWLDVIVGRQEFYRQEGIFILWVFNEFDYKDSTRKLAFSDIIYTNNYNAFIFDEDARAATLAKKDLVLKCYFQHHYAVEGQIRSKWESQLVTLEQLTFDASTLKVYYRDIALEKHLAAGQVNAYKAQQANEKQERRNERSRLRVVRAGYEAEHKVLQKSVEETGKEIEKLDKRLKDTLQYLDSCQRELPQVVEMAKDISGRLDSYWRTLPQPVEALKEELLKQKRRSNSEIKDMEDRLTKIAAKDNYYHKSRVKRVNGIEYHVLDRSRDWDFISKNAARLYAYKTDQEKNLFATATELQPLNNHKIQQMRHTVQLEFVIDFSQEIAANTMEFNRLTEALDKAKIQRAAFDEELPQKLQLALTNHYTERINKYNKEAGLIRDELENKRLNKEEVDKNADHLFGKIINLDYLDYYDNDEDYD